MPLPLLELGGRIITDFINLKKKKMIRGEKGRKGTPLFFRNSLTSPLYSHDFQFEETGELDDLSKLTELFVKNGFAERLEVEPTDKGQNYVWHNLYGIAAYKELYDIVDNPFLSCPLNLCLYYLADKQNKTMRLHNKIFDMKNKIAELQYEIVDKAIPKEAMFSHGICPD